MALPKDQTLPPDLTRSFTAVRGQAYADSQEDDADDDALLDNEMILNGSRAIMGPAAFSPLRADSPMHRKEVEKQQQEQSDKKRRDAAEREQIRELENLAEWNARMTTLGGVEMTNKDAQDARRHVIEHEDEYAQRAVDQGRIRADQVEEYKHRGRRIYEINDKIGRGTATGADKAELAEHMAAPVGQKTQSDALEFHKQEKALQVTATTKSADAMQALRTGSNAGVDDVFQSAPPAQAHFAAAASATTTSAPAVPADLTPARPARDLSATGFTP